MDARVWWPSAVPTVDAAGRVLLPLDPAPFAAGRRPRTIDGCRFEPKDEYHVTLVGSALGARICESRASRAALVRMLAGTVRTDWRVLPRSECLLVRRPAAPEVQAVVQLVAVPEAARLYALLDERLAEAVPRPPLHVTLYWAGDPRGIGLASRAALRERTVRRVPCGARTRRRAPPGL